MPLASAPFAIMMANPANPASFEMPPFSASAGLAVILQWGADYRAAVHASIAINRKLLVLYSRTRLIR